MPLSPDLQDFGERLRDAAEGQIERERLEAPEPRRSRRRRRIIVGAVLAVLLPAGAIAGAGALPSRDGEPIQAEKDLPDELRPATDPTVSRDSAVPDPEGGPPWAMRLATNARGDECFALGRLRNGRLGRQDPDGFRPFPDEIPLTCGDLEKDRVILMVSGYGEPTSRTVYHGISSGRAPIVVEVGGRRYEKRPTALGAFVIVLEGVGNVPGSVVTTTIDGRPFRQRY